MPRQSVTRASCPPISSPTMAANPPITVRRPKHRTSLAPGVEVATGRLGSDDAHRAGDALDASRNGKDLDVRADDAQHRDDDVGGDDAGPAPTDDAMRRTVPEWRMNWERGGGLDDAPGGPMPPVVLFYTVRPRVQIPGPPTTYLNSLEHIRRESQLGPWAVRSPAIPTILPRLLGDLQRSHRRQVRAGAARRVPAPVGA
jgi:hypothetical protein